MNALVSLRRSRSICRRIAGTTVALAMLGLAACGPSSLPTASSVPDDAPPPDTEPETGSATSERADTDVLVTEAPDTGTANGAAESRRTDVQTGDEWRDVTANLTGLESECGNVSHVSAHPATDQVVAGIALQGLWELEPAADRWDRLGTGAGSASIGHRLTSITYDPELPERFWESGSYDVGAFRTDDGGTTFEQLGDAEHLDAISVDLSDPDRSTMLAGRHEGNELLLSIDAGRSWTDVGGFPTDAGFPTSPFVIDSATFVVGTQRGDESGIYRSDDGGTTWSLEVEGDFPSPPVVSGDTVFWLSETSTYASDDGGRSFTRTGSAPFGISSSLALLPDRGLLAIGKNRLVVSSDRGATWEQIGPRLPFDPVGLAYSADRGEVFVWRFTCDLTLDVDPVVAGLIQSLELSTDT